MKSFDIKKNQVATWSDTSTQLKVIEIVRDMRFVL